MSAILLRCSSRVVFALICVMVLTRGPSVYSAEEASPSSMKVEESAAFAIDITPGAVELPPPTQVSVWLSHSDTGCDATPSRLHAYAILRI